MQSFSILSIDLRIDDKTLDDALTLAVKRVGFMLSEQQIKAVQSFIRGNDVFVNLPTGAGKSVCFWVLPTVYSALNHKPNSFIVVVSPLTALIQDQVKSMGEKGFEGVHIGSNVGTAEDILSGEYEILFFSPENLLTDIEWRDVLQLPVFHERLVGFVVDEVHCVKEW